jgi:hypothetical protein
MLKRIILLLAPFLASAQPKEARILDGAEVKIPYSELKRLLDADASRLESKASPPVLLSAKYTLVDGEDGPWMEAEYEVAAFAGSQASLPLLKAGLGMEVIEPDNVNVVVRDGALQFLPEIPGRQRIKARLLPLVNGDAFVFSPAECPLLTFRVGETRERRSVRLSSTSAVKMLDANQSIPLIGMVGDIEVAFLGEEEMKEAAKPPEPSEWSWHHEALILPGENEISYRMISRASSATGSGVAASLVLPTGARGVRVTGDDLSGHRVVVGANRVQTLEVAWETRGLLERGIVLSYEIPYRPSDLSWKLQVPVSSGSGETQVRYLIPVMPALSYVAEGLNGPISPRGLPEKLSQELKGASCYEVGGGSELALGVTRLPVAAVSDATMDDATWTMKVEPDGSALLEGVMTVTHSEAATLIFDSPGNLSLLKCSVNGRAVAPVSLNGGKLELALRAEGQPAKVECSFTGSIGALDPVEGTFSITLPRTPMFIRSLQWKIDLPSAYQAEVSGNVTRAMPTADEPPSRIVVRKNLCRDERPEAHIFYTRKSSGF